MKIKTKSGITLIVLVITIMVLVILVGILLKNMGKGENGIIEKQVGSGKNYEIAIGDSVEYIPSGVYEWNKEYATSDQTGIESLSSESGGEYQITSWKVFKINGDTVELVPASKISGTVKFQGPQGYNNGVKLLNDACSSLYSDSEKGITARSINIEDIESVMIDKENARVTGTSGVKYGNTNIASTIDKNYPVIYEREKNHNILEVPSIGSNKESELELSNQTQLIEKNEGTITESGKEGAKQASTSVQLMQTSYSLNNSDFSNSLKTGYSEILLPDGEYDHYWIASRCVDSMNCDYCLRYISFGSLDSIMLYQGSGERNTMAIPGVDFSKLNSAIREIVC